MLPLVVIVPTPKKDFRYSKICKSLLSKAKRNAGLISQPNELLALFIIPRWKQPSASISPVTHSENIKLEPRSLREDSLLIRFFVEKCRLWTGTLLLFKE